MTTEPPARLELLTRAGCHLCATALETVTRIAAEAGVGSREVDVDTDPELRAEYGDHVPVIFVDGVEHGYWGVAEDRLRAALAG